MRIVLPILLAATLAGAASAATVGADRGNLVVNGKAITAGGRDSDPVLSPDGKRVVFVRRGPVVAAMKWCSDETNGTHSVELWSIAADGRDARRLLSGLGTREPKTTVCDFQNMQFSSNGQLLYFETPAWATSGAAHVLDLKTGKEHFLMPSNGLRCSAIAAMRIIATT